jgi:hypothetical protein
VIGVPKPWQLEGKHLPTPHKQREDYALAIGLISQTMYQQKDRFLGVTNPGVVKVQANPVCPHLALIGL